MKYVNSSFSISAYDLCTIIPDYHLHQKMHGIMVVSLVWSIAHPYVCLHNITTQPVHILYAGNNDGVKYF